MIADADTAPKNGGELADQVQRAANEIRATGHALTKTADAIEAVLSNQSGAGVVYVDTELFEKAILAYGQYLNARSRQRDTAAEVMCAFVEQAALAETPPAGTA